MYDMGGALKLLLLASLFLLGSAKYNSLDSALREHIDKALKEANNKYGGNNHVAFHSLINSPKLGDSYNVNVLLQVTTCRKDSMKPYQHRDECVTRKNKTPLIDCLVCKRNNEELTDCARKFEVEQHKNIRAVCEHLIGSEILFSRMPGNEYKVKTRCLRCV